VHGISVFFEPRRTYVIYLGLVNTQFRALRAHKIRRQRGLERAVGG